MRRWSDYGLRRRNSSISAPACRPRTLDRPLLAYERLRTRDTFPESYAVSLKLASRLNSRQGFRTHYFFQTSSTNSKLLDVIGFHIRIRMYSSHAPLGGILWEIIRRLVTSLASMWLIGWMLVYVTIELCEVERIKWCCNSLDQLCDRLSRLQRNQFSYVASIIYVLIYLFENVAYACELVFEVRAVSCNLKFVAVRRILCNLFK